MLTYEYIISITLAKRSCNDSYQQKPFFQCIFSSKPPKLPIKIHYTTTLTPIPLTPQNNINTKDDKNPKRSQTTKNTATLISKIKTAATIKLKKGSKRLKQKKHKN